MSECSKMVIKAISSSLSTLYRSSVLGNAIRTLGREISTQVAATKQMTAEGLSTSCTTQLLSLNRALKTAELSQLGGETSKRLTPSTVATLQNLEGALDTGRLTQTVAAGQITSALNEMTTAVKTAHKTLAKLVHNRYSVAAGNRPQSVLRPSGGYRRLCSSGNRHRGCGVPFFVARLPLAGYREHTASCAR